MLTLDLEASCFNIQFRISPDTMSDFYMIRESFDLQEVTTKYLFSLQTFLFHVQTVRLWFCWPGVRRSNNHTRNILTIKITEPQASFNIAHVVSAHSGVFQTSFQILHHPEHPLHKVWQLLPDPQSQRVWKKFYKASI